MAVRWRRRDDGRHSLAYELGWRLLDNPTRAASRALRQHLGHSIKSSVAHVFRADTFPDPFWPRDGTGVRCGNAQFVRVEATGLPRTLLLPRNGRVSGAARALGLAKGSGLMSLGFKD